MLLRTLLVMILGRRRSRIGMHEVGRIRMRVLPGDLDILGHVNNGVYFSLMDLGRIDQALRSGAWQEGLGRGWYPVAGSEMITFRKSLTLWQRYTLESRIIGYDDRAAYIEQRFVYRGEVCVQAIVRARFLKRSGGPVTMAEYGDAFGFDTASMPVPEWMRKWSEDVALPSPRVVFASDWD